MSISKVIIASDDVADFVTKYNAVCDVTTDIFSVVPTRLTGGTGALSLRQNQSGNAAGGDYTLVTGSNNIANATNSAVVGGSGTVLGGSAQKTFVGGGQDNDVNGANSGLVGGQTHTLNGSSSFIGGGSNNTLLNNFNFIAGGVLNVISGGSACFVTGYNNRCFAGATSGAGVFGGANNLMNATVYSVILGGNGITGSTNNTAYMPNSCHQSNSGIHFQTGSTSGAYFGVATMVAGTVTVSTTAVKPNSVILVTPKLVTTPGACYISTITNGTSFVIDCTTSMAGQVSWMIVNPE